MSQFSDQPTAPDTLITSIFHALPIASTRFERISSLTEKHNRRLSGQFIPHINLPGTLNDLSLSPATNPRDKIFAGLGILPICLRNCPAIESLSTKTFSSLISGSRLTGLDCQAGLSTGKYSRVGFHYPRNEYWGKRVRYIVQAEPTVAR